MKTIAVLIVIGAIMKLPVKEDITWLRDTSCVMIFLTGLLIPEGDMFGLTIIIIIGFLAVLNLLYNVSYDKFEVERVKELEKQIREYNYLIFNLEEEYKAVKLSNEDIKKYVQEDKDTVNIIVNDLFNIYDEDNADYLEIQGLLQDLKRLINNPLVIKRSAYDLNMECKSNKDRRRMLRRINSIKEEYDLGMEFDLQLDEMSNKLKKELE